MLTDCVCNTCANSADYTKKYTALFKKKDVLLLMAGSSKEDIIKEIERILPSQFHYVGASNGRF